MIRERNRVCPHCGEVLEYGSDGWRDPENTPHDNPFACIAYLRGQVKEALDRLERHNL